MFSHCSPQGLSCSSNNYNRVLDENGDFLYKINVHKNTPLPIKHARVGERGKRDGQFNKVCGVAVYGADMILVCDAGNNRVQVFTQEGQFVQSFGGFGPSDVVATLYGEVLVLDSWPDNRVQIWR